MTMSATAPLSVSSVVMRAARGSDGIALARLAALDSKPAPRGEVLIAEVDGALHAALQLDGGVMLADPFKPTADLVALLELRAGDARRRRARRGLAERLRLRPAPRARAA
jgi:hypothetical protein